LYSKKKFFTKNLQTFKNEISLQVFPSIWVQILSPQILSYLLKAINVDVSVLPVMFTFSGRTICPSQVPAEEPGDRQIQNTALEGSALPLCNK